MYVYAENINKKYSQQEFRHELCEYDIGINQIETHYIYCVITNYAEKNLREIQYCLKQNQIILFFCVPMKQKMCQIILFILFS